MTVAHAPRHDKRFALLPDSALATALPDLDDLLFLEVAATAEAILVTGNLRHFPKKVCGGIRIIRPAECLELLRQQTGPRP
jgi:hypothetical protein